MTAISKSRTQKTVLFGPFVGEFGWELLYWQGWVRRACRTVFKDYYKVAASFAGRYPFYTDVDEFCAHPPEIISRKILSSKGYASDNWFCGLAERGENRDTAKGGRELWEGSALISTLTQLYQRQFPDALFLSPSGWINLPELPPAFGTRIEKHPDGTFSLTNERIRLKHQVMEPLSPTDKGKEILRAIVPPETKLLTIFPRARLTRRPDKNWQRESYEQLISWLQKTYPQYTVAILGEPGGAYFSEGKVPAGCIDLVSLDYQVRTDVQLAALRQSRLAVGSMSGAFAMALGAGCPSLMWGPGKPHRAYWYDANYKRTLLVFIPNIQPTLSRVCNEMSAMLRKVSLRQRVRFTYYQWIDLACVGLANRTLGIISRMLGAGAK